VCGKVRGEMSQQGFIEGEDGGGDEAKKGREGGRTS
jgi:hypothetical protein